MAGLHALVVDDSKVGRLTMLKKLEAIGIQVDLAESGREALDYLASRRPELIFMDHMMPEMDGFEVTRRIKATPGLADIPVIIVSGNDEPAFVDEARAAGAIDAIAKPPPPGVLEALLAGLSKAAAPLEAAPPPVVASAPASVATFDQDALRDWLEQQLEVALAPIRDALRTELAEGFEARLEAHGRTLDELTLGGRERLDEQRAALAGLRAELQAVGDRLEQDVSALRATGQASLDDRAVGIEQRLAMLEGRQEELASGSARLAEETRAAQADWARRFEELAQRLANIEQAEAARRDEVAPASADEVFAARLADMQAALHAQDEALRTIVAAGHEAQWTRLAGQQAQLQAGLDEARGRLESLERQRESPAISEYKAEPEPEAEPKIAAEPKIEAVAPPAEHPARSDDGARDELARLKNRLNTLTLALAIGGGALLLAVGMLLLKG